ncbi:MAG: fucose isomerase, partial [Alphaproteobacteria bacterium]|nr:fucose isomerase [Alphaproteobacteria bacterium]
AAPDAKGLDLSLQELFDGKRLAKNEIGVEIETTFSDDINLAATKALQTLKGRKIGRIGQHPDGFDTCKYDDQKLEDLAGIKVDQLSLEQLFDTARAVPDQDVAETRAKAAADLTGLDDVDQEELDKSLRLKNALDTIRNHNDYAAFAIRCWPETFTEYGGSVCGPISMMSENRVPCACEADVYGALSSLVLQELAGAPAFQVDLVDLDVEDDTGVVWHCGQAPISMADPDSHPAATIHTNRRKPLLYEFPLKPGRVTFARFSQAHGETKLVILTGEVLKRPMSFTGTSGVVRYDKPASEVLDRLIGSGIEHHTCMVYGDFLPQLRAIAHEMKIKTLEIC